MTVVAKQTEQFNLSVIAVNYMFSFRFSTRKELDFHKVFYSIDH